MTDDAQNRERFSLSRWSARKHAAARGEPPAPVQREEPPMRPASEAPPQPPVAAPPATADAAPILPPIESLTPQSDFVPFMQPDVDPTLKRAALKKLFSDPHFNVMDGLDVYIDDYSKPDPIAPEIVKRLAQARYLFDPPKTRVNEHGAVEDVPPDALDEAQAKPPTARPAIEESPPEQTAALPVPPAEAIDPAKT